MKRVLVTGGTGFVGANLVRRLLREGHRVHLLVRPQYSAWRIEDIQAEVQLHELDLADPAALTAALERIRPEWVFHLAAHGAYSWQTNRSQIISTNFLGTVHLVEACLKTGFEAFVHTGSSSEYGFKDHPPAETEFLEPNSDYAVAKAAATQFCRSVAQSQNLPLTTLRLYSAYGPFEEPKRLMPGLLRQAMAGQLPPLVNPATARDYVYVEDVCEACILAAQNALRHPGAVYNVGSGVQTTLRELVATAQRLFPIKAEPQWGSMPGRVWDSSVWVSDSRRIAAELGWKARVTLEEGLVLFRDWLAAFNARKPGIYS